jgi:threonyl-tRNA synthetase
MSAIPIDTSRHSLAHLMAQAITRVFPEEHIQFGVGPVIKNGFYYDIDIDKKLEEEDLKKIEEMMERLISEKLPIVKKVFATKEEAIKCFKEKKQAYKIELIESFAPGDEISTYSQGEFIDLCEGPHVDNTSQLPKSFKLLSIAGAYWRGDEKNKMLQRIYACAFNDRKELKEHLQFLEQAKARDHRKLGKELDLFMFLPVAPGSPFFLPKGAFIYNELQEFMRRIYRRYNYSEVVTPQILDSALWHTSGHYAHYKENMYFTDIDEREFAVKPMNCPCHMLMFKNQRYSYRDLPLRFADFGRLHRYEKSGSLSGLTRVRTFCQDDAHIFIPLNQIQEEIKELMEMFFICYDHFGFKEIKVNLSTRPAEKSGDDATWDKAENALEMALKASGQEYHIKAGDGAFYGPKIDVEIADAIGRFYQLGTIQLDFQLPQRFELVFNNKEGELEQPVVIHRALLGSLERFFGIYLEHVAGAYPFWLAPEQAVIVPVNNENHLAFAQEFCQKLKDHGFRVAIDDRNESMGYKTRQIQKSKTPFMLVIGDKEIESGEISYRKYGEMKSQNLNQKELIEMFKTLDLEKVPAKLRVQND